jgi:hypothetical protein
MKFQLHKRTKFKRYVIQYGGCNLGESVAFFKITANKFEMSSSEKPVTVRNDICVNSSFAISRCIHISKHLPHEYILLII